MLTDFRSRMYAWQHFKDDMQQFFAKLMQKSFLAAYYNINPYVQSFSNQPLFQCYYRLGWVQSAVALEKRLVTKQYG